MPLDVLDVSGQVRQMGELLASRRADQERRTVLLDRMLAQYADRWVELADLAESVRTRVAVPTGPLDERIPAARRLEAYTALATDGAEIDPDRHGGAGEFYVINIGQVRIPYGQPAREVELKSVTRLGYTEDDLFIVDPRDARRQVPMRDRHLDALRTVEELRGLADLAEAEVTRDNTPREPAVAFVDGTLLFSVLEERPRDFLRSRFYTEFVAQLERLRQAHTPVAAYASRSRGVDLVNLFRAVCGGTPLACDVCSGAHACALRGLTDAQILGRELAPWQRTGLFRVRSNVHDPFFGPHRVYYFLLATTEEVARVEVPEWVARDQRLLNLVHAALVDQCLKGFGYPSVLARADDRAVISLGDRHVLETLVQQELSRRGVSARGSAKLTRKQVRTV
ncbi:MAG: DNA double-strand break repair nuclease NurA [Chloroflexi bacterium]|nr:DNA double-strand break repair nuclease NurA [Chloroflexota bacterium]